MKIAAHKFSLKQTIQLLILSMGIIYVAWVFPQSMIWSAFKTTFVNVEDQMDVQEGDFVFQHLPGKLLAVIADVTESPYSHCGIVVKREGKYYVLEAIGPVRLTPLNEWVHRGIGSKVTVARLKSRYQSTIPKMIKAGYEYLGRPYDIQYEWGDNRIYCSELIYKAAVKGGGVVLAEFKRLGDLNWKPHEEFIRSVAYGKLPLERKMITPVDIVRSDKVGVVYSTFKEEIVHQSTVR